LLQHKGSNKKVHLASPGAVLIFNSTNIHRETLAGINDLKIARLLHQFIPDAPDRAEIVSAFQPFRYAGNQ